ncbi:hypothetical protein GCM10022215_29580 [Nocardioides fonticola]|uniref:Holin n=1 Tax=Nocardioides fonticola TaxID=450363 RepID=A0ABP7XP96_9ACTN
MKIWTTTFWARAATRGVRTTAQTAAGMLAASGAGLVDADWLGVASASGMAGLIAVLMNVGGQGQDDVVPPAA